MVSLLIILSLIHERSCFQYITLSRTRDLSISEKCFVFAKRKSFTVIRRSMPTMDVESITPTGKDRERQAMALGQRGLSFFQDPDVLGPLLGGTGRAKMVWSCLKDGIDPCSDQGVESPKTKLLLSTCFEGLPTISKQTIASCGTTKLLLDLKDGLQVESKTYRSKLAI